MKKAVLWLVVVLGLAIAGRSAIGATTIFEDDFNRNVSNSTTTFNTVGNSWVELENDANDVSLFYDGLAHLGVLKLRDELSGNPDAAATHFAINTTGLSDIQLVFDWKPLGPSESDDKLYTAYCLGNSCSNWTNQPTSGLGLGGSSWTVGQSINLAGAGNNAQLKIRFWTDVSSSDEGALIDNVRVLGSAVSPAPEPEIYVMLAAGLGLMGFVARRRRERQ